MPGLVEFETPENVHVSYQTAGLGSRFIAWFVDSMILGVILFVLFIILVIAGAGSEEIMRDLGRSLENTQPGQPPELPFYFWGVAILILGLGGFVYYGLSEFLMNGQTIGKRQLAIRVVKVDGFSLDLASILLRNIFRAADHVPALWIVPVLTKNSQRLGDMVAGTVVVKEEQATMSRLRERLLKRPASESVFSFDAATLERARASDVEAIEKMLERWGGIGRTMRAKLLASACIPLAERLKVEAPEPDQQQRFLEDFLAAEYRRQYRRLG
jgi:uncharacterized RDD family membrane protein YckC